MKPNLIYRIVPCLVTLTDLVSCYLCGLSAIAEFLVIQGAAADPTGEFMMLRRLFTWLRRETLYSSHSPLPGCLWHLVMGTSPLDPSTHALLLLLFYEMTTPVPSLLGHCKQKQRGLRGLLCRWLSITEWEMFITAQGCRLRNDLYCVEWDVKLYCTIPCVITLPVVS